VQAMENDNEIFHSPLYELQLVVGVVVEASCNDPS